MRTVAEQDALYAKGRTKPGNIVTNCKGSSYSSPHQWGIAADIYLDMDIDGDGKKSDDAFNNATKFFNKVGEIGKKLGLEWGGDWKSLVDMPHFQLPDWGSTTANLKKKYGTPDKFIKTWSSSTTKETAVESYSKTAVEPAKSFNKKYSKKYTTTKGLYLKAGAGKSKGALLTIKKGQPVICYGYYTVSGGITWLLVSYGKYTGYVSLNGLK